MATGRIPDPNSAPITAKGDLYTYSTVPARLAVGSNGDTLVADSAATTGLRWEGNYAAGKNKIINGDFRINQRNFSSTTTNGTYGFDRFKMDRGSGGTVTYSAQTFTPGTAPVSGYEAINFARIVTASQSATGDFAGLRQLIEDVRTTAGKTVTISVWAKAGTAGHKFNFTVEQIWGTGGSSATVNLGASQTLTTSWARYSTTFTLPSASGKTITSDSTASIWMFTSGGSGLSAYTDIGNQNATIDFWGLQVEIGSVATAFQTATGTLQGELAACQRYYFRTTATAQYQPFGGFALSESTSQCLTMFTFPVTMRVRPTTLDSASVRFYDVVSATAYSGGTLTLADSTPNIGMTRYTHTSSPFTLGRMMITNTDSATGFYGFSAEL
jgi:hypothetical protein